MTPEQERLFELFTTYALVGAIPAIWFIWRTLWLWRRGKQHFASLGNEKIQRIAIWKYVDRQGIFPYTDEVSSELERHNHKYTDRYISYVQDAHHSEHGSIFVMIFFTFMWPVGIMYVICQAISATYAHWSRAEVVVKESKKKKKLSLSDLNDKDYNILKMLVKEEEDKLDYTRINR